MEDDERASRQPGAYQEAEDRAAYDFESEDDDWHGSQARRSGGRRASPGPSFGRILVYGFLIVLFLVVAVGAFGFYLYTSARARLFDGDPSAQGTVVFTVRNGDTLPLVLSRLEKEGVLGKYRFYDDRTLITLYREWSDEPFTLKAGTVKIEKSASLVSVLQTLQSGGTREYSLTIPEGKTAAEVAELAKRKQPQFDTEKFVNLTKDPEFVRKMGVDEATLEGYLFPSTYDFPPGTTPELLIEYMVRGFRRTYGEVTRNTPNSTGRPLREIVIIASLVEKEARTDSDRPLISGVIENRLNRNMRLQIDATVNFALGSWRRLTYADYKFDSTFNTYLNDGLPPGPICSPGAASLRAALDPQGSNYIFYVHKGDGHHAFAETYEEHLANVRAYIKNDPDALRVVEEQAIKTPAPTAEPMTLPSQTPATPSSTPPLTEPIATPGAAPTAPRQY